MFTATMRYAAELLTWQHHDVLPRGLQPQHVDNTYVTMLFNDEVHTYQQVWIMYIVRRFQCNLRNTCLLSFTTMREKSARVWVSEASGSVRARRV